LAKAQYTVNTVYPCHLTRQENLWMQSKLLFESDQIIAIIFTHPSLSLKFLCIIELSYIFFVITHNSIKKSFF